MVIQRNYAVSEGLKLVNFSWMLFGGHILKECKQKPLSLVQNVQECTFEQGIQWPYGNVFFHPKDFHCHIGQIPNQSTFTVWGKQKHSQIWTPNWPVLLLLFWSDIWRDESADTYKEDGRWHDADTVLSLLIPSWLILEVLRPPGQFCWIHLFEGLKRFLEGWL